MPSSGADIIVDATLDAGFSIDTFEMSYQFIGGTSGIVDGVPVKGASNRYAFSLPSSDVCPGEVSFEFMAKLTNGDEYPDQGGPYTLPVVDGAVTVAEWNGNSSAGWTLGLGSDTATDGQWDRGQPEGNNRGDPAVDGSGSANGQAFLTDIDSGTTNSDVDGGFTTLLSPVFDGTAIEGAVISYQRWYDDLFGAAPGLDQMDISISNNGGSSWQILEVVTESVGAWVTVEFPIESVIAHQPDATSIRGR